jgi:tetratricopeptide (TPR) repeat protein
MWVCSLAELYMSLDRWSDVIRVTDGVRANESNLSTEILVYRAIALEQQGMNDAALQVLREVLRFRKRNPVLLRLAHYVRGRAYEDSGKKSLEKKEYERVLAEESAFLDVRERLASL